MREGFCASKTIGRDGSKNSIPLFSTGGGVLVNIKNKGCCHDNNRGQHPIKDATIDPLLGFRILLCRFVVRH